MGEPLPRIAAIKLTLLSYIFRKKDVYYRRKDNKKMIKDPKTRTMTFRLTEEEYGYLEQSAEMMGTTASRFVRQLIQMAINTTRIAARKMAEATVEAKTMADDLREKESVAMKEDNNEEQKALLDSKLQH